MKKAELQAKVYELEAQVARLSAARERGVRRPIDAVEQLIDRVDPSSLEKEHFWAILMDGRQKVLEIITVAVGSLTQVNVHPRELFRQAIRIGAHSMILAHNHPSGDTDASGSDVELSLRMVKVGELVGIPVLDSIILGHGRDYSSMVADGLIERWNG